MFKKIVAMLMICAMLIPLSPAVAADNTSVQPTIEEILNEYHQKAFAAQTAPDGATASTYSRQATGSSKTLEQETVDELTSAGYEAYNVTSENYNTLETTLRTDFGELGLDPDGSYIVVISGEDPTSPANSTRGPDLILPPHTENDGGTDDGNTFVYDRNGKSYVMRYVTVTSTDDPDLVENTAYTVTEPSLIPEKTSDTIEAVIWYYAEKAYGVCASFASFLTDYFEDGSIADLGANGYVFNASTQWIFSYIEVLDVETEMWKRVQRSVRANSTAYISSFIFNEATQFSDPVLGEVCRFSEYSLNYNSTDDRKLIAATYFDRGGRSYDPAIDVAFYLTEDRDISVDEYFIPLFVDHESPLFVHYQSTT